MNPAPQANRLRKIGRIVPRWYLDLDASHKPIAIVVAMLVGAVPLITVAFLAGLDMAQKRDAINALLEQPVAAKAEIARLADAFDAAGARARVALIAAVVYVTFVATTGAFVASAISKVWLRDLILFTSEAASRDLRREVQRNNKTQIGDIQEAMAKLLKNFSATIRRIERAGEDLSGAAVDMAKTSDESGRAIGEVAQSISGISEGAAHQVDLVTRTSKVVGDIEQATREAAAGAERARRQSADTELLTEDGVLRATEVQEAMESVRETSVSTSEMIGSLGEMSGDIDEIVHTITDIASQTNLLALNAAIEAARAGEQGRGFAVVAEEVRKLAEDAQGSAGEIAELIKEIQGQTAEAVEAMDAGMVRVERGFETVNRNRQAFYDISGAVRSFHASISEIATLAEAIAADAERVRQQIEEVASVAEQSSASTEEVSASTEQTAAAAQEVTAAAQRVADTAVSLGQLASSFMLRDEQPQENPEELDVKRAEKNTEKQP